MGPTTEPNPCCLKEEHRDTMKVLLDSPLIGPDRRPWLYLWNRDLIGSWSINTRPSHSLMLWVRKNLPWSSWWTRMSSIYLKMYPLPFSPSMALKTPFLFLALPSTSRGEIWALCLFALPIHSVSLNVHVVSSLRLLPQGNLLFSQMFICSSTQVWVDSRNHGETKASKIL